MQVERRLRAMLLDTLEFVPARRRPALQAQLARLDEGIEEAFAVSERPVAVIADYQGIGSRRIEGRRRPANGLG